MLTKINKKKNQKGFTLIELMIVIAIIGILAAIAIPQFNSYRKRSYNSSATSDVRNIATAQEAYYVDNAIYAGAVSLLDGATYGYYSSDRVSAVIKNNNITSYSVITWHSAGDHSYIIRGPGGSLSQIH